MWIADGHAARTGGAGVPVAPAPQERELDIVHEKNVRGAPALVVEILSDSTRAYDERTKRRLYARGGVRGYWIVDPTRNVVTVYRRMGSRMLCRAATHAASDRAALTTPLLPGFFAPLDVILA